MKNHTFVYLFFLLISMNFYGQDFQKDKIKSLKIAYITKDLSLTSSEAEKFWPVYNAFDSKQFDLRMVKMRKVRHDLKSRDIDAFSDAEANALLTQIENLEDEMFQNRKKLILDLRKIISPVKILKLKESEDSFNKTLLKQYRQRN